LTTAAHTRTHTHTHTHTHTPVLCWWGDKSWHSCFPQIEIECFYSGTLVHKQDSEPTNLL